MELERHESAIAVAATSSLFAASDAEILAFGRIAAHAERLPEHVGLLPAAKSSRRGPHRQHDGAQRLLVEDATHPVNAFDSKRTLDSGVLRRKHRLGENIPSAAKFI